MIMHRNCSNDEARVRFRGRNEQIRTTRTTVFRGSLVFFELALGDRN